MRRETFCFTINFNEIPEYIDRLFSASIGLHLNACCFPWGIFRYLKLYSKLVITIFSRENSGELRPGFYIDITSSASFCCQRNPVQFIVLFPTILVVLICWYGVIIIPLNP